MGIIKLIQQECEAKQMNESNLKNTKIPTPTSEQLSDAESIAALVYKVKQQINQIVEQSSSTTKYNYIVTGLHSILRKHLSLGLAGYSKSLVSEMVLEVSSAYDQGHTSRATYQNVRKASVLLSEFYQTGKITLSVLPNRKQRELTPVFAELVEHFYNHAIHDVAFSMSTINSAKSASRMFLFELESRSIKSFDEVTPLIVNEVITHLAKQYTGGLHSAIFCIKIFLKHVYENSFTSIDFSTAIPQLMADRVIYREGFSADEIKTLLQMPNRETAIGKRDYAMMLLATQTGLRACDIVKLKYEDIDWRRNEIHVVQQKTGKPLTIPLKAESGNAIAAYLLSGRPECSLPYIFLCHSGGLLRPLKNRSASAIVSRYLKRSGIISDIPNRGFHSFRRSLGTRLLQKETPIELLSQLLGHHQMNSAKPYLSVDEQGLKDCALSFIPNETVGDWV